MVSPPTPSSPSLPLRIQELHDRLDKLHDELHQLEADLEEHQSERSVKYKELKKKEEGIRGVWGEREWEGSRGVLAHIHTYLGTL